MHKALGSIPSTAIKKIVHTANKRNEREREREREREKERMGLLLLNSCNITWQLAYTFALYWQYCTF
jgi:hypothetical protein